MPLKQMAGGRLGVEASGGGVNLQIVDQRGSNAPPVEVSHETGPSGRQQMRILIREEIKSAIGSGHMDNAMQNTYGASRRAVRR
jgi:hypothetical protein